MKRNIQFFRAVIFCALPFLITACTGLIPPIDPVRVGETNGAENCTAWSRLAKNCVDMSAKVRYSMGTIPSSSSSDKIKPENTFWGQYAKSINNPTDLAPAQLYLESGLSLSDDMCSAWFDRLSQAQVRDATAKDLIGGVGSLSAVLMSLGDASSSAVGAMTGATNFAQRSIDSAMTNYVVAPDLGVVKRAIWLERSTARIQAIAELAATHNTSKYATANMLLIGYDNLCSHIEVKRLVNESVGAFADGAVGRTGLSQFYPTFLQTAVDALRVILPDTAKVDANAVIALYGMRKTSGKLTEAAKTSYTKLLKDQKIFNDSGAVTYNTARGGNDAQLDMILDNANLLGDLDKKLALDKSLKTETTVQTSTQNPPAAVNTSEAGVKQKVTPPVAEAPAQATAPNVVPLPPVGAGMSVPHL